MNGCLDDYFCTIARMSTNPSLYRTLEFQGVTRPKFLAVQRKQRLTMLASNVLTVSDLFHCYISDWS